jgi:hypothetical protein
LSVSSLIDDFVMADLIKQCISSKVCFMLGSTAFSTCEMLNRAFTVNAVVRTQTFEWFSVIGRGENLVEDFECSDCPSTVTQMDVENVLQNCQLSLTKHQFVDCWQVRPHVWNMSMNSKGGLYGSL